MSAREFVMVRSESVALGAFRVPRFELEIDGVALENRILRDVVELTYHDKLEEIDGFELVVSNWDATHRRFKYIGSEDAASAADPSRHELETLFEPCGKKVLVRLGYADQLEDMMTGTFTTMEPTFSGSGPHTLAVRGLNQLHRMRRAKYDGQWPKKPGALGVTDSEIAKSFDGLVDPKWKSSGQDARRIPLPIEIDANAKGDEPRIDFVTQKNEYDIDFLWRRGRIRGYVVEIRKYEGTDKEFLFFGPSTAKTPTPYRLTWGMGLLDLKITLTTANQVKKVTVHGWDRAKQKPIEESADWDDPKLKRLNPKLAEIVQKCDPREERVISRPVFTRDEARKAARDILLGHAYELVKAQGTVVGLPRLRAGSRILLDGIGMRLTGEYFVVETTHTLNANGYQTKFTARREDPDTGESIGAAV
jgi:Bacteriophage probable baseplate hub protein